MSDLIKEEALQNILCADCLEQKTYRLTDGQSETMWCPHTKNMVVWSAKHNPSGLVFPDVGDEEFFATVREARALADQAQAGMN